MRLFYTKSDMQHLQSVINSLNQVIVHKNCEIARLKAEIERNDRDIRALTAAIAGTDIDYPNGKGGNADNTGVSNELDFEDF
jgi:hypothetical protein